MGDFSTPVICMIFLSVLIVCESLPLQADEQQNLNRIHSKNKGNHKTTEIYEELSSPTLTMESVKNNSNESVYSYFVPKLIKHIEHFTKRLFRSLLQFEVSGKNNANAENVIEIDAEEHGISFQNRQRTKRHNKSYKSDTKKFKSESTNMPSDNSPKDVDRIVPKHRKHRERRSYLHDFGLALSYSDPEGDVIFGAHTSPCAYRDRHFCLNGGTCVFVGALEIKTCQCKIGYTGLRCQSINQEFLMALLSEEFFG